MLKFATVCCSPAGDPSPSRVIDVLDADLVDRNLARVGAALHVFDVDDASLRCDGLFHRPGWFGKGPHSLRAFTYGSTPRWGYWHRIGPQAR